MARFWFCELNSNPPGKAALTVLDGDRAPRFGNPDRPRRQAPGARILRFLRFDVLQIDVSDRCCIDVVSYDTVKKTFFLSFLAPLLVWSHRLARTYAHLSKAGSSSISAQKRKRRKKESSFPCVIFPSVLTVGWPTELGTVGRQAGRQAGTGSRQVHSNIGDYHIVSPIPNSVLLL